MQLRSTLAPLALVVLAAGCLELPEPGQDGRFACATSTDCLEGYSCNAGFCTKDGFPDDTDAVPQQVQSFSATSGDRELTLQWNRPAESDVVAVEIRQGDWGAPGSVYDGWQVYRGMDTSTVATGLTNDTSYYFSAFAIDARGQVSAPAQLVATPYDYTPPGYVENFQLTHSADGSSPVELFWTLPNTADLATVVIRRSTVQPPTWPSEGDHVYSGLGTYAQDYPPWVPGVTYHYAAFALDDESTPNVSEPRTASFRIAEVVPMFTIAANWNDWVNPEYSQPCDPYVTSNPSWRDCLHGGEVRMWKVPGLTTCDGLDIFDDLGAFEWACDASNGVTVFSTRLRPGVGVRQLIDTASLQWLPNFMRIYVGGSLIAQTQPETWWLNPIVDASPAGPFDSAGTVYVINRPEAVDTVVTTPRVTLVGAFPAPLTGSTASSSPVIEVRDTSFVWLEGLEVSPLADEIGMHVTNSRFVTVRNVGVFGGAFGAYLRWVNASTFSNLSASSAGQDGIGLETVAGSLFEGLTSANSSCSGIRLGGGSDRNLFVETRAFNNQCLCPEAAGLSLSGASNNVFVGVLSSSNDKAGIALVGSGYNTASNVLLNVTSVSNALSGIFVSGSFASDNTLSGLALLNNELRLADFSQYTTVQNAITDNVELADTNYNRFTGMLKVGGICSIVGGYEPGLADGCVNGSASDASLWLGGLTVSDAFAGPAYYDAVSPDAPSGSATYEYITRWTQLEGPFRTFGRDASMFPLASQRGRCGPAEQCRIWDWRVSANDLDATVRDTLGPAWHAELPHRWAAYDDYSCTQLPGSWWNGSTCTIRFLGSALEQSGANGDGLCEPGEVCYFPPHLGAYQGYPL